MSISSTGGNQGPPVKFSLGHRASDDHSLAVNEIMDRREAILPSLDRAW
jgi:hypothetical protein